MEKLRNRVKVGVSVGTAGGNLRGDKEFIVWRRWFIGLTGREPKVYNEVYVFEKGKIGYV
jgi:hypothetical protein